uniref:Uncharacterized protein n=1 Tax=Candidatus Kentrum sp. FW TaxID=2126338 RepID=A0A450RVR5_9GAMM|nr:MAG: hypothetical protein BECKFW1821A_GA0114235_100313 [Candidatus Kentron sp. FW]
MKFLFWLLCGLSVVGLFYASDIHTFLLGAQFYNLSDPSIIQIILGALAGIFATKASDSSREIKALLKIDKINDLLGEAETAESQAKTQREQLKKIEKLLASETEAEFARDMISRHRGQLEYHWSEILKLESLLDYEKESPEETKLRKRVRGYLIKSRYIEYMGRGFLRNIPLFGSVLHILIGPIWDEWYYRNLHRINKKFRATAHDKTSEANKIHEPQPDRPGQT